MGDERTLYFSWLTELVEGCGEYWRLNSVLHDINYTWTNPMDINRCADGMALRREFEDIYQLDTELEEELECSVLEMLIALAYHMADLIDAEVSDAYYILLGNLGLNVYDDVNYYDAGGEYDIREIVDRWLTGSYERNGKGGLFPLRYSRKDQRIRDIWYQMNVFIMDYR